MRRFAILAIARDVHRSTRGPDICHDGQDNEGEPGLIDGDDPNCQ